MTNIAKVIEKIVATYSEEKRIEVADWIVKLGIRTDDPLFNLYAELGTTQFELQQLPGRLETLVIDWGEMVDDKLKTASKVAIMQQKSAIAEAAKELIVETHQDKIQLTQKIKTWQWAQIAALLGGTLALGMILGILTSKIFAQPEVAHLPPKEQKLLDWAKSADGQTARTIYSKNAPIIKTCLQQKKFTGACIISVDREGVRE